MIPDSPGWWISPRFEGPRWFAIQEKKGLGAYLWSSYEDELAFVSNVTSDDWVQVNSLPPEDQPLPDSKYLIALQHKRIQFRPPKETRKSTQLFSLLGKF